MQILETCSSFLPSPSLGGPGDETRGGEGLGTGYMTSKGPQRLTAIVCYGVTSFLMTTVLSIMSCEVM